MTVRRARIVEGGYGGRPMLLHDFELRNGEEWIGVELSREERKRLLEMSALHEARKTYGAKPSARAVSEIFRRILAADELRRQEQVNIEAQIRARPDFGKTVFLREGTVMHIPVNNKSVTQLHFHDVFSDPHVTPEIRQALVQEGLRVLEPDGVFVVTSSGKERIWRQLARHFKPASESMREEIKRRLEPARSLRGLLVLVRRY